MPPGPHSIDDAKIRSRCASPEAARYTLFVRGLIGGPDVPGGQAEILRTAVSRGILPGRYTRQTLSEHLSGRYRHGPPWPTTEMIIECLPDHAPKVHLRNQARVLHEAVRRRPGNRSSADLAWPQASPTGVGWEQPPNAAGRHARRPRQRRPGPHGQEGPPGPGPHGQRRQNAGRVTGPGHRGGNAGGGAYHPPRAGGCEIGAGSGGPISQLAAEIADLRAECARLVVEVELARDPGADLARDPTTDLACRADLGSAFAGHRRSRLGELADHIDPTAPLARRALARYLCAYAELGRLTVTELAMRAGLTTATVAGILAAQRLPSDPELWRLSTVLGVDTVLLSRLTGHVFSDR